MAIVSAVERPEEYLYLIGSMRNPAVPHVAKRLRAAGFPTFDDWYSSGPEADEKWQEYERTRGRTYREALEGAHARNVFRFDKYHLSFAWGVVLMLPAGKSGHLELGWALGQGKPGFILLPEQVDRFDVMYRFATGVYETVEELVERLQAYRCPPLPPLPKGDLP